MPKALTGVLCLEGDWDADPTSRKTMEPALELLERMDILQLHHRNVNTTTELWRHLNAWCGADFVEFPFLYLGFHGYPEVLEIGDERLGLDTLREELYDCCTECYVVLGACGALKSTDEALTRFCKRTDAKALFGYTENIDFIESAAFEMILFSYLVEMETEGKTAKSIYKLLASTYPDLCKRLGFRVATKAWVSPLLT